MSHKLDAKQRSKKNRFLRFDSDIGSAYTAEDDDVFADKPQQRNERGGNRGRNRGATGRPGEVMHTGGQSRTDRRRLQMKMYSAPGSNAEMVHKVKVIRGSRFGVQWISKQLSQQVENFKPLLMKVTERGDVEFLLKDADAAGAVSAISRRVVHAPTQEKVTFLVEDTVAPWSRLQKAEIEAINEVVDSRYSEETKSLDLTNFATDPKLTEKGFHLTMTKNNVMLTIIDRIDEKYGHVTALSLKNNRLRLLEYLGVIVNVTKFVSVLDLSDNAIDDMDQLAKLKGLPVKTLFFEGNPVCERLTRSSDYLNAVHLVFPKVISLDANDVPAGAQLPPDLDDEAQSDEPQCMPPFYGDDNIQKLVETFVVQFLKLYDGADGAKTRKDLIDAYDQYNSKFQLTIANLPDNGLVRHPDDNVFSKYISNAHNLAQLDKWKKSRAPRVFKGAMDIAVQLSKLPLTKHYDESIMIDVFLVTPTLLGFTVQGLFEDGDNIFKENRVPSLSYFSRTFYVCPRGPEAVAVISDMLFISALTVDRLQRYYMLQKKCRSNVLKLQSNGPAQVPSTSLGTLAGEPSDDIKSQMVAQFSQDSGMNREWSTKCLLDAAWNYEVAGQQFLQVRAQIPPEAFTSTA